MSDELQMHIVGAVPSFGKPPLTSDVEVDVLDTRTGHRWRAWVRGCGEHYDERAVFDKVEDELRKRVNKECTEFDVLWQ